MTRKKSNHSKNEINRITVVTTTVLLVIIIIAITAEIILANNGIMENQLENQMDNAMENSVYSCSSELRTSHDNRGNIVNDFVACWQ